MWEREWKSSDSPSPIVHQTKVPLCDRIFRILGSENSWRLALTAFGGESATGLMIYLHDIRPCTRSTFCGQAFADCAPSLPRPRAAPGIPSTHVSSPGHLASTDKTCSRSGAFHTAATDPKWHVSGHLPLDHGGEVVAVVSSNPPLWPAHTHAFCTRALSQILVY